MLKGTFRANHFSSFQVIQEQCKKRLRKRNIVFILTLACLPISAFSLYDRFADIPDPLGKVKFPFLARFHIRKALWRDAKGGLSLVEKDLDAAFKAVLSAGLGAASPQATALLIYLTSRYIKDPNSTTDTLEQSLEALLKKPHVGEALEEERARISQSIKVFECLLTKKIGSQETSAYKEAIEKCIDKLPAGLAIKHRHELKNVLEK